MDSLLQALSSIRVADATTHAPPNASSSHPVRTAIPIAGLANLHPSKISGTCGGGLIVDDGDDDRPILFLDVVRRSIALLDRKMGVVLSRAALPRNVVEHLHGAVQLSWVGKRHAALRLLNWGIAIVEVLLGDEEDDDDETFDDVCSGGGGGSGGFGAAPTWVLKGTFRDFADVSSFKSTTNSALSTTFDPKTHLNILLIDTSKGLVLSTVTLKDAKALPSTTLISGFTSSAAKTFEHISFTPRSEQLFLSSSASLVVGKLVLESEGSSDGDGTLHFSPERTVLFGGPSKPLSIVQVESREEEGQAWLALRLEQVDPLQSMVSSQSKKQRPTITVLKSTTADAGDATEEGTMSGQFDDAINNDDADDDIASELFSVGPLNPISAATALGGGGGVGVSKGRVSVKSIAQLLTVRSEYTLEAVLVRQTGSEEEEDGKYEISSVSMPSAADMTHALKSQQQSAWSGCAPPQSTTRNNFAFTSNDSILVVPQHNTAPGVLVSITFNSTSKARSSTEKPSSSVLNLQLCCEGSNNWTLDLSHCAAKPAEEPHNHQKKLSNQQCDEVHSLDDRFIVGVASYRKPKERLNPSVLAYSCTLLDDQKHNEDSPSQPSLETNKATTASGTVDHDAEGGRGLLDRHAPSSVHFMATEAKPRCVSNLSVAEIELLPFVPPQSEEDQQSYTEDAAEAGSGLSVADRKALLNDLETMVDLKLGEMEARLRSEMLASEKRILDGLKQMLSSGK